MISSDIRGKSPMVRVLQQRDRRPTAILSASERASRSWITTVLHAPKSSRRTSPRRLGGPIATCRRTRHLLSPKAAAQGNDATGSGVLRNKGAPFLGDRAPALFHRQQTIAPIEAEAPCRTSRRVLRTARSGQGIRSGGATTCGRRTRIAAEETRHRALTNGTVAATLPNAFIDRPVG